MRTRSTTLRLLPCRTLLRLGLVLLLPAAVSPANAKDLDGYLDRAAFAKRLDTLAESPWVTITSLGKTLGGYDIPLVTITKSPEVSRPGILVVGQVTADLPVSGEVALRLAERIAAEADTDEALAELLSRRTLYLLPRPAPDAAYAFRETPIRPRDGNARKTDDDRDGEVGEDPPEDLNGDGYITQMRILDPAGKYLPHPNEPRILVPADPAKNERGIYRLLTEGVDNDQDEAWNEDPGDGVAFNRNFTFNYAPFVPGSGPNAVSEPETRAVADFIFDHPNILLVYTMGPEDTLLQVPPTKDNEGRIKTHIKKSDRPVLEYFASEYQKLEKQRHSPGGFGGAGAFTPWAYFHAGRWSLAARPWWIPTKVEKKSPQAESGEKKEAGGEGGEAGNEPARVPSASSSAEEGAADTPESTSPAESKVDTGKHDTADGENKSAKGDGEKPDKVDGRAEAERAALAYFDAQGIGGFVPWTAIEHPDFPGQTVEVGGFKPYRRDNPPAEELDGLAATQLTFVRQLLASLPQPVITRLEAESLGGGVFRLSLRVTNEGILPTSPEMGRTANEDYPLMITLELPEGVKLLTGTRRTRLAALAGNGGTDEPTWLLHAPDKPTTIPIRIESPAILPIISQVDLPTQ